jgi:hypothetical protein
MTRTCIDRVVELAFVEPHCDHDPVPLAARPGPPAGTIALVAFLVSTVACSGASPEGAVSTSEAIKRCPIGQSLDCEPGLGGRLLCGCVPDDVPPPPPCAALTCPTRAATVGGCHAGSNCPTETLWFDGCSRDAPASFTETVDWGDHGAPEVLQSAIQGCPYAPCPAFDTTYALFFQHTYAAPGTYSVNVTVKDVAVLEPSCTIPIVITVDP